MQWVKDVASEYGPIASLAGGIATVLGFLLGVRYSIWSKAWNKVRDFWRTDTRELKAQNSELTDRLVRVRDAFKDDNNLWLREPVGRPDGYDRHMHESIPILLVANLKGGVGKTTITANLASYFERVKGERVLAIDLDHQGSLTSMLLPEAVARTKRPAEAIKSMICGSTGVGDCLAQTAQLRHTQLDSRLVECDDPFGYFETRILLEWLIGDRKEDIRYNLARVLHSPEIQQGFDRIVIDAPPRITTGLMNALCGSTHLVVPFVLDILSAERVGLFLETLRRMRGQLFPHLQLAGVVGTMKGDVSATLRKAEEDALDEAMRGVSKHWGAGNYVLRNVLIPRKQAVADAAGVGVDPAVSKIFEPLGNKLYGLTTPGGLQATGQPPGTSTLTRGGSRYEGTLSGRRARQA